MSTKPGIPDHFSIHDVRDAAAGSPPAGGGTATRAQLHAMRDLSIPFDLDHPPTFDEAARLMREAYRFGDGVRFEPGRDILPKCNCGPGEICQTCAKDKSRQPVRDIREAMHPVSDRPLWTPPLLNSDGSMRAPYVATLPDGSRVNLPAGTVLREGEEAIPEHPVIALVRSFIGKPGDKPGPVWTALMCVQARLGDDDMAGAILAANELEEALNERLGQMHDALGRDTAEERTL